MGEYASQEEAFTLKHKKWHQVLGLLKSFFVVRHLSEYETLDSDQKGNRNIWPDADTRDTMNNVSS